MVQLKQITRNATFAWSPARGNPLIASGTIAGAVDASFSQNSELEIWDLDLDNTDTSAFELQPTAKLSTERKFYSLAWGYATPDKPRGVIAGAMDDGHLNIWDVNAILTNSNTPLITSNHTHSGAIKVVEFNPVSPKLLMSAGTGGEFYVWDLENPAQPFPAPNRANRADDIEAASWNRKVANILATARTNGFTSVWDLKQSREILHLQNPGRGRVSTLAWDPDNPTRIITGSGDDTTPSLYVWDLRNSNAPALTLEGHSAGVLSVAWCHLDHNLLLSCGKDNRTILWNPQVPKILGEFPIASTWAFETQWCPQNPDILANATFEGKITVHRLQSTMPKQEMNGTQPGAGEDFFSQRQYVSEGGFELKQAPKWLQVPCSASFGFGGSLVSVNSGKGKKEVKLSKYISEPEISENASQFEEAIRTADWTAYCEKQIDKASTDGERGNWELLRILFDNEPRKKLIEYLGIRESEVDGLLIDKVDAVKLEKTDSEATVAPETVPVPEPKNNNRLSGIFGDKTDDFLSQISPSPEVRPNSTGPFSILSSTDSESDKAITQAILFGRFDQAVGICLKEDRLADAFVLATLGDKALQKKVQEAYFSRNVQRSSYLRLLQSVIDSNLRDVAQSAELSGWKQILAVFCTFAKSDDEFAGLCDSLGQRLEGEDKVEDAKVCYLAGKKLDRVVSIWISEAETQEKSELKSDTNDSAFSIHARALQGFVEKVTVFKQTKGAIGGDLKPLYDKYTEFVEIVASQGNLSVAQKYIDLLPGENDAVKSVKTRLSKAMAKAPVAPITPARAAPRAPGSATRGGIPPATITSPYPQPQPNPFPQQYAPVAPAPASFPAPSAPVPPAIGSNPYAPRPGSTPQYTPSQPFNPYNPGFQPTNPTLSRVTDLPPPPPKKSNENWNDPPMLPNPVRARTPAAPLVKPPSPFPGQTFPGQPSAQSPGLQKPPPGPPPMTAKPPQRMKSPPISSPPVSQGQFLPQRPGFSPTPPMTQPPPSRPPQSTFTPPPGRSSQPPPPAGPPIGQYRPQSTPGQSRPQYAPSPIQQQPNNFPAPPSAPPGRGGPYTPQPGQTLPETPAAPPPPAKPTPPPAKFPPGDRTRIPATSRTIYDVFSSEMERIKQLAQAPQQKRIVTDVDKRLNILFDLLNNDDVPAPIISELVRLAQALMQRQFDVAAQIQLDLHTANEQYSTWMLGIKRLIDMARAFA